MHLPEQEEEPLAVKAAGAVVVVVDQEVAQHLEELVRVDVVVEGLVGIQEVSAAAVDPQPGAGVNSPSNQQDIEKHFQSYVRCLTRHEPSIFLFASQFFSRNENIYWSNKFPRKLFKCGSLFAL